MTFYYHRTLIPSSSITHAVLGNFLDENKEDILVSTGRVLKLLRFEPNDNVIQTLISEDTYCTICSLSKFRRKDRTKDWIVFTTDSGNATMLAVDAEKMSFEWILQENFDKKPRSLLIQHLSPDSQGRAVIMESNLEDVHNAKSTRKAKITRKVPGQYLAVDSQGCAIFIGAVESLGRFWLFIDPKDDYRVEFLDVEEKNALIYDIAFVDNSENPVIAYLTIAYTELYPGVIYELTKRPKPSLVFCEVNQQLKLTEIKRITCLDHANCLISVPGEKGLLVCAEDYIAYYSIDSSDIIRCSIPQRLKDPKKGVIFACSTIYNGKNSLYYLAQTEQGDIFKIQLIMSDSGVNEIILKYFITLPVASALCILESGYLFVASEFGDHHFYKIADIENRAKCQPSFSSALALPKCKHGWYCSCKHFYFCHRTVDIAPVAKITSMSPIMQMDFGSPLSTNSTQMYLATGRASLSALKISALQPDVSYQFRVKIDKKIEETPLHMWALESTKSIRGKPGILIVVSFENQTAVYALEEAFECVLQKVENTNIAGNTNTIGLVKTGEDVVLQLCPEGICLISDGENQLILETQQENAIENYAMNNKSLIVAFANEKLRKFNIDDNGHLKVAKIPSVSIIGSVTCMALTDKIASNQLLAVGISILISPMASPVTSPTANSSVNRIHLFIVSETEMKVSCILEVDSSPYSFLFLSSNTLLVGCEDGIVLTLIIQEMDTSKQNLEETTENIEHYTNSELIVSKIEKIGNEAVKLLFAPILGNECILAISDNSLLKESADKDFIPLKSDLNHCICILPEREGTQVGIATIFDDFCRIFLLNDLQSKPPVTFPLKYTPKSFVVGSHVYIIEADNNSYIEEILKIKKMEFQQYVAVAQGKQLASKLPPVGKIQKSWASLLQVVNLSTNSAREMRLVQNEVALSLCHLPIDDDNILLVVGVAKGFNPSSTCCKQASIRIYNVVAGKLVHKTFVKSPPLALCGYKETLMVAMGRKLALYHILSDPLTLELLCEMKECVSNSITAIYPLEDRILVSDSKFGSSCLKYVQSKDSHSLYLLEKDIAPVELTAACILNNDLTRDIKTEATKMIRATKSRDIFIVELGAIKNKDMSGVYNEDELPFTLSKEKLLACFHVGEVVTSMQPFNIFPNEPECVVYTTLSGSVGVLSPLPWEKDANYLNSLNKTLLKTVKEIDKNGSGLRLSEHFQFRSRHYKCENVIDGDFLDQFLNLEEECQEAISEEFEEYKTAVSEVMKEHQTAVSEEMEEILENKRRDILLTLFHILENINRETMLNFEF